MGMASVCISSCLDDARVPVRATYVNLYKWPESDAEFVRSRSSSSSSSAAAAAGNAVHGYGYGYGNGYSNSIWCRQMYLRSYRFSRKETVPEMTVKCFGKVKEKVVVAANGNGKRKRRRTRRLMRRKCLVWRKVKVALFKLFNTLLSCSATIDVVE